MAGCLPKTEKIDKWSTRQKTLEPLVYTNKGNVLSEKAEYAVFCSNIDYKFIARIAKFHITFKQVEVFVILHAINYRIKHT